LASNASRRRKKRKRWKRRRRATIKHSSALEISLTTGIFIIK